MNQRSANSVRLLIVVAFGVISAAVIVRSGSAQNPTPGIATQAVVAQKTVDEVRKNIQVLKGLPDSQLVPVMNYMSASLGVKCGFCHVNKDNNWDFASDEKGEKKTARVMITMVTGVNKTTFNGNTEVSCYTCHRGRTSPVSTPQLPIPEPSPRPEQGGQNQQAREALPAADQILDKYIEALGGSAAIEKLKSRTLKGTLTTANGASAGYELSQSAPDMVLAVITTPQGTVQRGFDGTAGWEKSSRGVRDLGAPEVYYLRRYPNILRDIKLKDQFTRFNTAFKTRLNDRDVYVVRATAADRHREQLYFDVETGLLVRRVTTLTTPVGNIPEEVDFEDYRDVGGVKMPFIVRVLSTDPNYSVVRKFTEIKINPTLDPKVFDKPA
ncbi:MAG: c-type cytochrome [Pyrinomonadaceae bacterium]